MQYLIHCISKRNPPYTQGLHMMNRILYQTFTPSLKKQSKIFTGRTFLLVSDIRFDNPRLADLIAISTNAIRSNNRFQGLNYFFSMHVCCYTAFGELVSYRWIDL